MKTTEFVNDLGNTNWKIVSEINDGYPILNWQDEKVVTTYGVDNTLGTENVKIASGEFAFYNPVIPVGFKTSNEGASWKLTEFAESVEGWNDGLIIEDSEGNQFVWVPTPTGTYNKWFDSTVSSGVTNDSAVDDNLPIGNNGEEILENTQIEKYGGFYVARYEAGIPTDDENLKTGLTTASKDTRNKNGIPESKKNQIPWNYIDYTIAKANAESMYSSNFVKSGLVTGRQWDRIMKWLSNSNVDVITNGESWGNYGPANVSGVTQYSTDRGASWNNVNLTTKYSGSS